MSRWFNILYGSGKPEPAQPPRSGTPNGAPPGGNPAAEAGDTNGFNPPRSPARPLNRKLSPAPPLPSLPARWALEIQKIVFHLGNSTEGEFFPQCIVFSGMQKQAGTTTVSYLVAHHVAVELVDQRVLFVDFSIDHNRPAPPGTQTVLRIGQALEDDLFGDDDKALIRFSIRPGDDSSVATTSRWFKEFIALARESCSVIIIDAPPFVSASETYSVSKASDGVVMVLRSGQTRYPSLNGLVSDIEQLGIRLLGTVLNFRQYPIPPWLLKYV